MRGVIVLLTGPPPVKVLTSAKSPKLPIVEVIADRDQRMQRREGVLKDIGEGAAAQLPEALVPRGQ